jgi:hypothetical protein
MSTNIEKTAYEWSKKFGVQILDPDGFGERYVGRPSMDELMDINMFNKCIRISTIWIFDKEKFGIVS